MTCHTALQKKELARFFWQSSNADKRYVCIGAVESSIKLEMRRSARTRSAGESTDAAGVTAAAPSAVDPAVSTENGDATMIVENDSASDAGDAGDAGDASDAGGEGESEAVDESEDEVPSTEQELALEASRVEAELKALGLSEAALPSNPVSESKDDMRVEMKDPRLREVQSRYEVPAICHFTWYDLARRVIACYSCTGVADCCG